MRWRFWQRDDIQENNVNDRREPINYGPMNDSIAPLDYLTYSPLPLEASRNDIYAQGYIWPKGQSDHAKWYNNTYWGNRLPDPFVGIGMGPGYAGRVTQKMFWTQYSPEQKFIHQWTLQGGYYPYSMSVQQSADLIASQQALWAYSAGHA